MTTPNCDIAEQCETIVHHTARFLLQLADAGCLTALDLGADHHHRTHTLDRPLAANIHRGARR